MNVVRGAVLAAASAACFLVGRAIGTSDEVRVVATNATTDLRPTPSARIDGVSPQPSPPPRAAVAHSSPTLATPHDSPWERALRADGVGAQATHQAVIRVMEKRRRAMRWHECPGRDDSIGASKLAVSVDVHAHGDTLEVRDASAVRVEDGVALAPALLACLARQLRGHDVVDVTGGLQAYAGPVDFHFGVDFGESPLDP